MSHFFRESLCVLPVTSVKEDGTAVFEESSSGAKYPVFMIDVIGTKYPSRNDRQYTKQSFTDYARNEEGVWSGIRGSVHNAGNPVLKHHRSSDVEDFFGGVSKLAEDPVGRVMKAEYLEDGKGNGFVRYHVMVFDDEVAEGLRSGKYAEFSIAGISDKITCSICGAEKYTYGEDMCEHRRGVWYDEKGNAYRTKPQGKKSQKARDVMGRTWLFEVSIVNIPGYAHTGVVGEVTTNNASESGSLPYDKEADLSGFKILEVCEVGQKFVESDDDQIVNLKDIISKMKDNAKSEESIQYMDDISQEEETNVAKPNDKETDPAATVEEQAPIAETEQPKTADADKAIVEATTADKMIADTIINGLKESVGKLDKASYGEVFGMAFEHLDAEASYGLFMNAIEAVTKAKSFAESFSIVMSVFTKKTSNESAPREGQDAPAEVPDAAATNDEANVSDNSQEETTTTDNTTTQESATTDTDTETVTEATEIPVMTPRGIDSQESDKTHDNLHTESDSKRKDSSNNSGFLLVGRKFIEVNKSN